jgi:hypothetical protein
MYLFRLKYLQAIRNIPENEESIKQLCGDKFVKLNNDLTYLYTKPSVEFVPRGFYILKITKNHFYVMPDDVFELLFIQEDKP